MSNVQQPEMRRTETTALTNSDTSTGGGRDGGSTGGDEHRKVPKDQVSPYGPSDRTAGGDDDED
jgi:hypothetical protein